MHSKSIPGHLHSTSCQSLAPGTGKTLRNTVQIGAGTGKTLRNTAQIGADLLRSCRNWDKVLVVVCSAKWGISIALGRSCSQTVVLLMENYPN